MVGRFVEYQHVRFIDGKTGEDQSCRLTPGKARQPLFDLVSRKQHLSEAAPDRTDRFTTACSCKPALDGGVAPRQGLAVILGKVPGLHLVSPAYLSAVRLELTHCNLE